MEGAAEAFQVRAIGRIRSTLRSRKGAPRSDSSNPLTGVFLTRSPDRPNPIGIHRVTVRAIEGTRLRIGPIEAIDGTPVIDVKSG